MKYGIRLIRDPKEWEKYYLQQDPTIFVQSPQYAEFCQNYGDEAWFVGVFQDDKLIGGTIVIKVQAKRGNFLYLPYGPVLNWNNLDYWPLLTKYLKNTALGENCVAVKCSPWLTDMVAHKNIFKKAGWRSSPLHILAETSWVLELKDSEDELLKGMRQNHRNLVRRAGRDGVVIRQSQDLKDLKIFFDLHQETVLRHKFTPFSKKYIETEFQAFAKNGSASVFIADYQGASIAVAIIIFYGNTAVYRHGASSSKYPKVPAVYALLWEAIKVAKGRGLKYFNFWGIAPDNNKKHPFAGITRFKTGFGGERYNLLHCQDLPVGFRYWFSWVVDRYRKWKRGF